MMRDGPKIDSKQTKDGRNNSKRAASCPSLSLRAPALLPFFLVLITSHCI